MHNRKRQCGGRGCNRRMGQFLDPALLLLLKQSPAHGYTLLSRMSEFGLDFLAPAVIYRALREMETQGWVSSTWDVEETQGPPRRVYALTPRGQAVLRCCLEQLRSTQQVLEYILALHDELSSGQAAAPPIAQEQPRRVAIPATGADLDALISPIFGRCPVFILADPETLAFEALENPAFSASGGAGVQAAQSILQRGVRAIIAPRLGPNVFRVIEAAGVPVYRLQGATVREAIEAFNAGQLRPLEAAAADPVGRGGQHRHGRRG